MAKENQKPEKPKRDEPKEESNLNDYVDIMADKDAEIARLKQTLKDGQVREQLKSDKEMAADRMALLQARLARRDCDEIYPIEIRRVFRMEMRAIERGDWKPPTYSRSGAVLNPGWTPPKRKKNYEGFV